METVFLKLLNMSATASWLILAAVLLRILLSKAPKAIHCVLWMLAGIRLIVPFTWESILSLIPSAEIVSPEILFSETPAIHSGIDVLNQAVNPVISQSPTPTAGASVNPMQIITAVTSPVFCPLILIKLETISPQTIGRPEAGAIMAQISKNGLVSFRRKSLQKLFLMQWIHKNIF